MKELEELRTRCDDLQKLNEELEQKNRVLESKLEKMHKLVGELWYEFNTRCKEIYQND